MGVREHISRGHDASAHVVQFFDSDETRHDAVAAFLADGYLSGCPLILIARHRNSAVILDRLQKAGVRIKRDAASGRVTVLDATETLRRISRTGSPSVHPFDDVVGTLAARVSHHGRIYAYGEMVDILAQRGDFADVTALEALWNRLLARTPMSLMCGYAAAHFVSATTQETLRDVCAAHSDVRVEHQDPLAAWLLAQAQ